MKDQTQDDSRLPGILRPDESIVWTGHGGGSSDLRILFYLLFVGVFAAPSLAFVHFAVAPLSGQSVTYVLVGCLGAATFVSKLVRGPDTSKRDYVLTNQRLIVGNADPTHSTVVDIFCEADQRTITKVRVMGQSEYSAIRIELNNQGQKRTIKLLDQERPAEVADLICKTLQIA
jgi:hypothetical protein